MVCQTNSKQLSSEKGYTLLRGYFLIQEIAKPTIWIFVNPCSFSNNLTGSMCRHSEKQQDH